jgi:hypothetical protein
MLRSALSQGPESQHWSHIAKEAVEWAATQGYELLPSDPLLADYVRAFARADLDANAAIARRNQGDAVPTPERPAGEVWTMSHIVPHFLEHKGPTQGTKHVQTIVNAWRLLTDYCGDIPLDEVTSEHIYGFLLGRMKAAHKPWSYDRARGFGQRALRDVFGFARTRGFMKAANPLPPEGLEAFPVVEQPARAAAVPVYPGATQRALCIRLVRPGERGFQGKDAGRPRRALLGSAPEHPSRQSGP